MKPEDYVAERNSRPEAVPGKLPSRTMVPKPPDEDDRLANLREYAILDSLPEAEYDDLVTLAAEICQTPVAQISLVDADRQWYKAEYGIKVPGGQTAREDSFCSYTILNKVDPLVVSDLRADTRFKGNRFVTGDPRVVFYAGVPLCSPAGHALGTICVLDQKPRTMTPGQVTALQRLSRQVVQLLELRRSLATSQRRLREREYAYRLLQDFSHIIAHDLKAPVRNIRQAAEMLREDLTGVLPAEQDELFGMIESRAADASRMIDGVLRYSKVARSVKVVRETVAIRPLVQRITNSVGNNCCRVQYAGTVEEAYTSPIALTHILQNLIGNAVKFNDRPDAEVWVHGDFAENGDMIFRVRDNGPGIPPEHLDAVFRLFHSAGNDTRGGHGVGLSIVRRLVEDLNGTVGVESELENGTTFTFRLPVN